MSIVLQRKGAFTHISGDRLLRSQGFTASFAEMDVRAALHIRRKMKADDTFSSFYHPLLKYYNMDEGQFASIKSAPIMALLSVTAEVARDESRQADIVEQPSEASQKTLKKKNKSKNES